MKVLDALKTWWKSPVIVPPDRPARVETLEKRYGVRLPEDFRRYLLTTCPDDYMMDDGITIWWEAKDIKSVAEELSDPEYASSFDPMTKQYLLFADYMFWCWGWAVCCDQGEDYGKVAFIMSKPKRFVANSFDEFVAKYLRDRHSVF